MGGKVDFQGEREGRADWRRASGCQSPDTWYGKPASLSNGGRLHEGQPDKKETSVLVSLFLTLCVDDPIDSMIGQDRSRFSVRLAGRKPERWSGADRGEREDGGEWEEGFLRGNPPKGTHHIF